MTQELLARANQLDFMITAYQHYLKIFEEPMKEQSVLTLTSPKGKIRVINVSPELVGYMNIQVRNELDTMEREFANLGNEQLKPPPEQ